MRVLVSFFGINLNYFNFIDNAALPRMPNVGWRGILTTSRIYKRSVSATCVFDLDRGVDRLMPGRYSRVNYFLKFSNYLLNSADSTTNIFFRGNAYGVLAPAYGKF